MLVFKKVKKQDPAYNMLVSLTSIPGKVMEQLNLETISRHMKKKIIRSTQCGFTKSCLTNLVSFYNEIMSLMDEQGAVGIVFLDFCEAFDAVPC